MWNRVIPVNGIEMYVQGEGEGEPLLLLHGGSGAGINWRLIFQSSPDGYETIIPDLRGHGRTTGSADRITFRQLALDVMRLLDTLNIESFKAIGISMGANTMLHIATQTPERVKAMVLVSAAPYFPDATRLIMRAAASKIHPDEDWELMRQWHVHGDDQIKAIWGMANQFANDYEDMNFGPPLLGRILARTLIVHGEHDSLYPVSLAKELYESIPHSDLWIIPNGEHNSIFGEEVVKSFASTALSFLNN